MISVACKSERDPEDRYTTQLLHTAPKSTVNTDIMPCQLNCEVHRLNLELKIKKTDKIKTLTELYQVTNELGRDNRHRRNEVSRIERKLMTTIAERLYIEDEISRGCPACRQTWNPETKLPTRWQNPRTPQTAVPSSNDMWQWQCLQVWRKWH